MTRVVKRCGAVRHRIDGLENTVSPTLIRIKVRHRIDGLERYHHPTVRH